MKKFYPISQPKIGDREIATVTDAVASGWVSSIGKYIEEFERKFADFCGTRYALATSNGTTGLHLALVCKGVGPDDEVIVPDLTFVATANAVRYTGAKAVLVDVDAESLCIDPAAIERAITSRTKAIVPVHLYGHAARMDKIMQIAQKHSIAVIEDAAEAHGSEFAGRRVGSIGEIGVFSFYGNKVITSGEGGMLTVNSEELYRHAKYLRDHAMDPAKRYWHTEIGFNYRMTNLQAALGVAQMEKIDSFIAKRREIMNWYRDELQGLPRIRMNRDEVGTKNVYWMVCLEVEGLDEASRSQLMAHLKANGVDSRPYFYPISDMPMYAQADTPVAHAVSQRGINLPSYIDLDRKDVTAIATEVREALTALKLA